MLEEPVVIACAADDNFAMPMAVMAFSVLKNLEREVPVHFYLLDGGIQPENKASIEAIIQANSEAVETTWLSPPEEFRSNTWNTTQDLTDATLLCLFLPDLLPASVEKVLYLDCDLIVNAPITELWSKEVRDHPLMAVQDFGVVNVSTQYGIPVYKELGLDPSTPYFNAGVLLIDCEAWKKEEIGKKAVAYLNTYRDVQRFNDQEAMNAVIRGGFGHLPFHWNQQSILFRADSDEPPFSQLSTIEFQALKENPKIIHYTEHPNPWVGRCMHPHRDAFLRCLRECGWYSNGEWLKFKSKYQVLSTRQYTYDLYRHLCDVSRPMRHTIRDALRTG